eukprot:7892696-Pyramimonas_sp.AAC.1
MDSHSNEGGEWFLARSHRPVQYLSGAQAAGGLRAERGNMYDGFVPCIVHMRGFSLAIFSFYGHSGVGFRDSNAVRFRKLGCLLRSLQIPWI